MPLYMDVHTLDGDVTVDDVAKAHMADLQIQSKYDVRYLRYWVDEDAGKIFCLVEAPVARGVEHRAPRGARTGRRRGLRGQGGVMRAHPSGHRARGRRCLSRARAVPAATASALSRADEHDMPTRLRPPPASHARRRQPGHRRPRRHPASTRTSRNAKAHGYGLFHDVDGVACIAMPGMGAMGIHFVNGGLVGDGKVRLKQPEAVVYARENGHRRLVALEYVVLRKDWERVHGADAHRPWLFGHRFDLTHAGNRYGLPAFYSLHAWIWKDNPAGRSRCGTRTCTAPVADVTTRQGRCESRDEDGCAASSRQSRTVTERFEVSETPQIAVSAALPFAE